MANDRVVEELDRFLTERADPLMRTAVLLTGNREAAQDLLQTKVIHERRLKVRWTLYVDPTTYLPVRMSGSSYTFGGPAPSSLFTSVTDVQWLRPTAANVASALVTIPAGFQQVSSPADQ
jgi:hypothetical protein